MIVMLPAGLPPPPCALPVPLRDEETGGLRGYVPAAGAVLSWWLCVVSGMIAGCDRSPAGRAARGSA